MTNVVQFRKQEDDVRVTTGPCVCTGCKHEWVGVAPVGLNALECPECGHHKGRRKGKVLPSEAWTCNCGETLYFLTPEGAMCQSCGILELSWADQ